MSYIVQTYVSELDVLLIIPIQCGNNLTLYVDGVFLRILQILPSHQLIWEYWFWEKGFACQKWKQQNIVLFGGEIEIVFFSLPQPPMNNDKFIFLMD